MIGKFVSNESEIYKLALTTTKKEPLQFLIPNKSNSYTVLQHDNLNSIAKKFNISITQLKNWNGLQTNYVIEGQRLVITNKKETQKTSINHKTTAHKTYIVKEGDSLWRISKLFPNTTIAQLKKWNNLWSISFLKPGTQLKILTQ